MILVQLHESDYMTNFSNTPTTVNKFTESPTAHPIQVTTLDLGYEPSLPEIKWRNSKATICYLASKLWEFPITFVNEGRTPFIHNQLYSKRSPCQMQEAYRVCEIVSQGKRQDVEAQSSLLKPILEELKKERARAASFDDLLASVQALMLYLVICLFSAIPDLRRTGEEYCYLLDLWTRSLREQAPAELSHTLSAWQAWYFAESVRRTIIISHMIRGVYATLKQGYHIHTLYVEALPFDPQTLLWDAQSATAWTKCTPPTRPQMLSYREYVNGYAIGKLAPTGLFERLLLTACYGKEKVEAKTMQR